MWQGWIWPVELHPGDHRKPVISDGFGTAASGKRGGKGHYGVDIMYRRSPAGSAKLPAQTAGFEVPSGQIQALAAFDGTVWAVNRADAHGISVEIDHHRVPDIGPRVTVYRHLASSPLAKGQTVKAGGLVGIVGYDTTAAASATPNHLHFELWDTSRAGGSDPRRDFGVDPAPFMKDWGYRGRSGAYEAPTGVPPVPGQEPGEPGEGAPLLAVGIGLYAAKVILIG